MVCRLTQDVHNGLQLEINHSITFIYYLHFFSLCANLVVLIIVIITAILMQQPGLTSAYGSYPTNGSSLQIMYTDKTPSDHISMASENGRPKNISGDLNVDDKHDTVSTLICTIRNRKCRLAHSQETCSCKPATDSSITV